MMSNWGYKNQRPEGVLSASSEQRQPWLWADMLQRLPVCKPKPPHPGSHQQQFRGCCGGRRAEHKWPLRQSQRPGIEGMAGRLENTPCASKESCA